MSERVLCDGYRSVNILHGVRARLLYHVMQHGYTSGTTCNAVGLGKDTLTCVPDLKLLWDSEFRSSDRDHKDSLDSQAVVVSAEH
jgi:hypothetical protein